MPGCIYVVCSWGGNRHPVFLISASLDMVVHLRQELRVSRRPALHVSENIINGLVLLLTNL